MEALISMKSKLISFLKIFRFKKKPKSNKPSVFRNMPIGYKYLSVFLISIALFIVATAVVFFQLDTAKQDVENIIQKSELANDMAQLALYIEQQDSLISNYVIVGSVRYIDEFNEINDRLEGVIENLENEFKGDGENEFLFERVKENNEKITNLFLNQIAGKDNLAEDKLIYARIQVGTHKTSSVALLNRIIEEVNDEQAAATANVSSSMDKSTTFLIVVNAISIMIGLAIMMVISRMISSHLKNIVSATTEIAEGNLAVDEMGYRGKDEIGQLTNAVNTLSKNMSNILHKVAEASKSVSTSSESLTLSAREVKEGSEQMVVTMEE